MSAGSLQEVYVDELCDLWSANEQMAAALKEMTGKITDGKLKKTLDHSISGIDKHTAMLRQILEAAGGKAEKEHCRGMEGLVREAKKHALQEAPSDPTLADVEIVAQYQRMSHYGLAGFGTAAAYAHALGRASDEKMLHKIVSDIYKSDELGSRMAEQLEKAAA